MTTTRSLIALCAAVALVAAACSSSPPAPPEQGDGTRLGQKDDDKKKGPAGKKPGRAAGKKGGGSGKGTEAGGPASGNGGGGGVAAPPPAAGGQGAPTGFASDGPPSPVDPTLARRSSFVDEPEPDAKKEGAIVPDYAELLRAGVQGLGEEFEMRLTFNGDVPEQTPDKNTIMVIGFGISAGGDDTYGFTAQGNQDGWKAYAGAKDGARKLPGQFLIDGDTIIMRVPWSTINGPREFKWQVNSTWFRSVASTTHYAFDQCPNGEAAQFPGS
ncbi:MAG: hypothetical protein M3N53_01995 [Actinomycetota bacterium]|nr:hypothetical protein [Actinomycetota bacterium]